MKMMSRWSVILAILLLVIANVSSVMAKPDDEQRVTLVEFSDFQCPFCAKFFQDTLPQIKALYGDQVKIVYKHFPLSFHENAQNAAEASECARDQGEFWKYHDMLFRNQQALDMDSLKKYAAVLDLDTEKFNECVDGHRKKEVVLNDVNDGVGRGVEGTPTIFVFADENNYEKIVGTQPFSVYQAAINKALKKTWQSPPTVTATTTSTATYMPTPTSTSIFCDMTNVITEGETDEGAHKVTLEKADVTTAMATLIVDGESYTLSAYEQKPRNGVKVFGVGQIEGKNAVKYGLGCKQTTMPPVMSPPTAPQCPVYTLTEGASGSYETAYGKVEIHIKDIDRGAVDDRGRGKIQFLVNDNPITAWEDMSIPLRDGGRIYVYAVRNVYASNRSGWEEAIKFNFDCPKQNTEPAFPTVTIPAPTPAWPAPACPVNILTENEYGAYETEHGKLEITATFIEPPTGELGFVINGEQEKGKEYSTITLDNGEQVYVYNIGLVNDKDAIKFSVDCRNKVPEIPPTEFNAICCDIPRTPGDISQGVEHVWMPTAKCQDVRGTPTIAFNCENAASPQVCCDIDGTPRMLPQLGCSYLGGKEVLPAACVPEVIGEPAENAAIPPPYAYPTHDISEEDKYKYLEEKRRQAEQAFGCANGCATDHSCLAYGIRMLNQQTKKPVYCDIDGEFKPQRADNSECQNNYECLSNTCSNGACINLQQELQRTQGLLEKVLGWLRGVFG